MEGHGPASTYQSGVYYIVLVMVTAAVAYAAGLEPRQVGAVAVFSGIIYGALFFWKFRLAFAFFGLAGMLLLSVIDVPTIIDFAGLDIVLFLVGMMIVVGFLEERKLFEHLVEGIIARVGSSGTRLTVALMLLAALFAALVDEVTSILFMAATVLHLTTRRNLRPLPFLLMIIFATNIGSSATVVGNPVGVMIALRGGLTFADFLRWATPVALAALLLAIPITMAYFRKDIQALDAALKARAPRSPSPEEAAATRREMRVPALLLIGTLASLVAHSQIEALLGLQKNAMLVGTALIAAGIALVLDRARARELVERRVDWWTLTFFLVFFASVGALHLVGVTSFLASGLVDAFGANPAVLFIVFVWVAAVLSAFMDNVLAVAMFIPIVAELGALGMDVAPLWWGMLFAATLFGNLTMIGSTANIVAVGMLERRNLAHIRFREWIKPGAVISLPTLGLATLLLYVQFYL